MTGGKAVPHGFQIVFHLVNHRFVNVFLPVLTLYNVVEGCYLVFLRKKDVDLAPSHRFVHFGLIAHESEKLSSLVLKLPCFGVLKTSPFKFNLGGTHSLAFALCKEIISFLYKGFAYFQKTSAVLLAGICGCPHGFIKCHLCVVRNLKMGNKVVFLPFYASLLSKFGPVSRHHGSDKEGLVVSFSPKTGHPVFICQDVMY